MPGQLKSIAQNLPPKTTKHVMPTNKSLMPNKKAAPIGSPISAFDAAENVIDEIGAKTILDCPAGQGAFAERLIKKNLVVRCCDIRPAEFVLDQVECDFCDMNDALPYQSEEFDAVACLNGIHRIWARGRAISEIARVLKRGGHAIITIPNPTNLMRRLSYFATGVSLPNTVGPPDAFLTASDEPPAATVRLPISIPEIEAVCNSVGLYIEQVISVRTCKVSMFLLPLIVPIWLLASVARRGGRVRKSLFVNSFGAVMSERILILARKL
jgi:SAM-dependent methyltransferase